MLYKVEVPAYTLDQSKTYYIDTDKGLQFPVLTIDRESYIVRARIFSMINWAFDEGVYNLQIGRHSSLAEDITFMIDFNHDYLSVFQGIIKELSVAHSRRIDRKGEIIIENDCWIGNGVTIMGGVVVHNGAVVGANSVVTKDVPPYAIVGGNPAKVIKYRFSEPIIRKLLKIAWWDWSIEKIVENQNDMIDSVDSFVDKFYKDIPDKMPQVNLNRKTGGALYVFYSDIKEPFSLTEKVIRQFAGCFEGKDAELLIYVNPDNIEFCDEWDKIVSILNKYEDSNLNFNLCKIRLEDETDLLRYADCFITNRQKSNIYRLCKSEQYGLKHLSGVDASIFKNRNE